MPGKKRGPKPLKPTDDQRKMVSQMAAVGIPQEQIARAIVEGGMAVETLQKYFGEELEVSAIKANAKVAGSMYNRAINGDTAAAKWWSACRMGWKETQAKEISGPGGTPIENKWTVEFVNATPKSEPQT